VVHYGVNGKTSSGEAMGHEGLLFYRFAPFGLIEEERRYLDSLTPMAQIGMPGLGPKRSLPALPRSPQRYAAKRSPDERRNVDLVKEVFGALDSNDRASFTAAFAEDAVLDDLTLPTILDGKGSVDDWLTRWTGAISKARSEITTIIGVGDFVVAEMIVRGTLSGTLDPISASNKAFIVHRAVVAQVRDRHIIRLSLFMNRQELAKAVGQWPLLKGH
jgi:ketosteroid isomerase-like protein